MKDWAGNSNSIWKTLGASNHTDKERQSEDYYATDSSAIDKLLSTGIKLSNRVLEPACGEGHLSKRLENFGYSVLSTDLIDRGYGKGGVDFLKDYNEANKWDGDIITNPPYKCYDLDTEVYTKRGWLKYNEVKTDDYILSLNPETQELEWSGINKIIIRKFDPNSEKMFHFKKNLVDIMCTDQHRMYVKSKKLSNIAFCTDKNGDLLCSEKVREHHYIPRTGYKWLGNNVENFILPSVEGYVFAQPVKKEAISIPIKDWLDFFGLWIADGYCRHGKNSQGNYRKTVGIKQCVKNADVVRKIIGKLPFSVKEYLDKNRENPCINFEIHNEQLWSYLIQFGLSNEKFIPEWIKDLNTELLSVFIESYFLGDGSTVKNGGRIYRTISKQLITDIQEILLKLGYLSHIVTYDYFTKENKKKTVYMINYQPNTIYSRYYLPSNKSEKLTCNYSGFVWCLNLKKNGVMFLRRNGKEFFCGNCALNFVKHALDIVENGRKVIMFLKLTFLEGVERGEFFKTNPPKKVLVFSKRIMCAKNGNFEEMKAGGGSAVAYAWFIWEKGFQGKPEIEWI